MFKKTAVAVLLFILLLTTVSCYKHTIVLNGDRKSGKMIVEYSMDDDVFQLLSIAMSNFSTDYENQFDAFALIDEDYFKETVKSTDEVTIKSVSIKSDGVNYKGRIEAEFKDFEKALATLPEGLAKLNIERSKNNLTISQELDIDSMDPDGILKEFVNQLKEDDPGFYNKIMKEAYFEFIIQSAKPIVKSEGVKLSSDKKSAYYNFYVGEMLDLKGKVMKFLISM
jgi:hypothetical protein